MNFVGPFSTQTPFPRLRCCAMTRSANTSLQRLSSFVPLTSALLAMSPNSHKMSYADRTVHCVIALITIHFAERMFRLLLSREVTQVQAVQHHFRYGFRASIVRSRWIHLTSLTFYPEVKITGLKKITLSRLPDVFAVVSIDGEEKWKSEKPRKSLDPYWEDNALLYAIGTSLFLRDC